MIDWLADYAVSVKNNNDSYLGYSLEDLNNSFKCIPLVREAILVLSEDENSWLKFAVLDFFSRSKEEGTILTCLFHGQGPSGNLRECRHTYWGEEGYIFFPDGAVIAAAFKELSKYFDGLV